MSFRSKQPKSVEGIEFSVVDVETTGLFPERGDRIIEIAVVRVNFAGKPLDEYATLVNPGRDVGPTHIHHISSTEVKEAPPFAEVAGNVLSRLAGTIFAGYYPHFDFGFLRSEVSRLGHEIPPAGLLCVNELARDVAPDLPGRKLEVCCKHFGILLSDSHSACADALATARLLQECFRRTRLNVPTLLGHLEIQPFPSASDIWPGLKPNEMSYTRDSAASAMRAEPNYIARLVASLPLAASAGQNLNRYYAVLDRVLEDRIVTADEAAILFSLAREAGISRKQAEDAHCNYTRDLALAALADGVITQKEEEDLRRVSRLLSITDSKFESVLLEAKAAAESGSFTLANSAQRELVGLSVCFTGEFTCRIQGYRATRGFAEAVAQRRGMEIRKGVTKGLDILVAADPNSMSGKAKKARQYNIRIVAEPVFWHWMNVDIE